jgi:DedD protein
MDQGLKERLIGAAVLVAFGVWLIPWVLDGQSEQSESRSTALQLPVPEQPVPMRSQTIRLDEEHQPPAPAAEPEITTARAAEPVPEVTATVDSAPEQTSPAVSDAPPERDIEQSESAAEPPQAPAVASAPSTAPASVQSGWVVQLGSFSEEGNARRLAQRVSTFGYRADISTHRASGRVLYRVRVGPHESRGRAEAAASALTAHGFPAQVVAAD